MILILRFSIKLSSFLRLWLVYYYAGLTFGWRFKTIKLSKYQQRSTIPNQPWYSSSKFDERLYRKPYRIKLSRQWYLCRQWSKKKGSRTVFFDILKTGKFVCFLVFGFLWNSIFDKRWKYSEYLRCWVWYKLFRNCLWKRNEYLHTMSAVYSLILYVLSPCFGLSFWRLWGFNRKSNDK